MGPEYKKDKDTRDVNFRISQPKNQCFGLKKGCALEEVTYYKGHRAEDSECLFLVIWNSIFQQISSKQLIYTRYCSWS